MYSLTEKTFIAWGANEELAVRLSSYLDSKKIDNIVGGHSARFGEDSDHLPQRVISQMKQAARAIILAQGVKQPDGSYAFRPNLMFEWGYLLSRLPTGSIMVVYIDTPREAGPSDLQGALSEVLPSNLKKSRKAEWIANQFLKRPPNIRFSAFDVCYDWSKHKIFLKNQIDQESAPSPSKFEKTLLTSFIPAVYNNDIGFLRQVIDKVRESGENANNTYLILANGICSYVEYVTSNYNNYRKTKFSELKKSFSNCANSHDTYVAAIARNYMGKCLLKQCQLESDASKRIDLLKYAELNFRYSLVEFERSPLDSRSLNIWLSFVYRNLAIATFEIEGRSMNSLEYSELALKAREDVFLSLSSSLEGVSSRFFEAEYYLSVCDYVKISGDTNFTPFQDISDFIDDEAKSNWLWTKVFRNFKVLSES